MKRCPDCGFRANDEICPLCGVRMRGSNTPVQTHTHTQTGERCVLPNREQSVGDRETHKSQYHPQRSGKKTNGTPSRVVIAIAVVILIGVFRSCAGIY